MALVGNDSFKDKTVDELLVHLHGVDPDPVFSSDASTSLVTQLSADDESQRLSLPPAPPALLQELTRRPSLRRMVKPVVHRYPLRSLSRERKL